LPAIVWCSGGQNLASAREVTEFCRLTPVSSCTAIMESQGEDENRWDCYGYSYDDYDPYDSEDSNGDRTVGDELFDVGIARVPPCLLRRTVAMLRRRYRPYHPDNDTLELCWIRAIGLEFPDTPLGTLRAIHPFLLPQWLLRVFATYQVRPRTLFWVRGYAGVNKDLRAQA
jgi:hypothetical protein